MQQLQIEWKVNRLDEGEEPNTLIGECLLEIKGSITCNGAAAGIVEAFYLYAEDPASPAAFMELWDSDGRTCDVYEAIKDPTREDMRDPLLFFLDIASAILCVHFIALRPQYRQIGIGREVMKQLLQQFADPRVGLVLLNATPLQHSPYGYDVFDEEVRDLPWNSPEEDQARLIRHFATWGMQHFEGTPFVFACPETLQECPNHEWPLFPVTHEWDDEE